MLVVLSPSKKLDCAFKGGDYTKPLFERETADLAAVMKKKKRGDIAKLMHLSEKLASLNYERYQAFAKDYTEANAAQAILAFQGDVYDGLNAVTLKKADLDFAQNHIRILSGLYGMLRPLDLMQPYRLEMGTKLVTKKGNSLYDYWSNTIANQLNDDAKDQKNQTLINLASNEYFKAVKPKEYKGRVVTIGFKEHKNGVYKSLMLYVKRARGMMARYIIDKRIDQPETLKKFKEDGYSFNADLSKENEWIFTR